MRIGDSHYNRHQVLRELHRREPVSRTMLSVATGLNAATISAITGDLVERGVVVEEKPRASGIGRPRVNLRLSVDSHFTLCAVIVPSEGLRIAIVDLRGGIVHSTLVTLQRTARVEDLAREICRHLAQALAASGIDRAKILNVALGLPAVVERQTGVVHYFETFASGPVDVRAIVEAELGLPASIDNAHSLLASCEHWYGNHAASENFVLLMIDLGVSSAVYRDGLLHSGRHGIEPEIGHSKVFAAGGRACRCGASGCVEAYVSISAILGQLIELNTSDYMAALELYERFEQAALPQGVPSPAAVPLFRQAGGILGTAVANLVNIDDPERIVILVPSRGYADAVRPTFDAALLRDTWPTLRGRVEVEFKEYDSAMYLRGAAALTLERFYEQRPQ
ncbi:MAG: ROK family protein [Sphingomonadales bacterium]|nr:ROK family protein [Sphingomonadales bacterium]